LSLDDNKNMRCDQVHEALSARLDDELPEIEATALDSHLADCPSCQSYARALGELHRAWRVRPAEAVPDLTAAVMAATADRLPDPRPRPVFDWVRYGVFAVGLSQLLLSLPLMLLGLEGDTPLHTTRELGAFGVALSVGMLVVAWQPRRAAGLLPVAVALCAGVLVTAIADVISGRSPMLGEVHHVLELVGVILLWRLSRTVEPTPGAGSSGRAPLAA
jgi:predicted anti-sigma-YlaC factor YlaD